MKIHSDAPVINLKLANGYFKAFLIFVFITCFAETTVYAQPNDQLNSVQLNRNLQNLDRNNLIIHRIQENNVLHPETISGNVAELKPNQTFIVRSKAKRIADMNRTVYNNMDRELKKVYSPSDIKMLPERYIQTGSNVSNQLAYRIGFESKLPLEYFFNTRQFEGSMKFILLPESPTGDFNLKVPVLIEIVSDYIRTINPVTKEINHLSIPLTEIKFQGKDLTDSAQIKIITRSNPEGYETFLKVKPAVELDSRRSTLQGLGVQKIPISIKLLGSTINDSVKVTFNAEKGTVEPVSVYVHYNQPKVVNLRSEGLGHTTLTASSIFNSNELSFNYIFPWVFILMAVIGGIIGGLVKYFAKQEKLSLSNSILKGILIGFMGAVVYYVLGFSLLEFKVSDIFNEFAVLGFSALVAFFGIRAGEKTA